VTKTLETQQRNLDAVVKKLDGVLQHYSCSHDVFNVIQLGPDNENIDTYLEALIKLFKAKEYFLSTGTGTVELVRNQNFKSIHNLTHIFLSGKCDSSV
jgi:hypothetical protein